MKKIRLMAFMLIMTMGLCGCYDADEPNDIVYTVALGIDKSETEGEYEITIQFAKPTQISGGASEEGGKGGSETFSLVTVNAPTIYSAVNLANHIVSKRFTLSHTKLIVFSEEVAMEGVIGMADTIARSSDIRPNIYLAVAKGGAKKYLSGINPVVEINPEKYYQLIFENEYAGYIPKNLSQNFYFYMNSKERNSILPIAAIEEKTQDSKEEKSSSGGEQKSGGSGGGEKGQQGGESQSGEEQEKSSQQEKKQEREIPVNKQGFEFNVKDYVAGRMDVEKENEGEVMGLAVFQKDRMIAELNSIESQLYSIANGEFVYSYTNYYSKASPEYPTTLRLEQERHPVYHIDVSDDRPKIKIDVYLEGDFLSVSPFEYLENEMTEYEKELTEYTEQALMKFLKKTSNELGADIVGFGSHAKACFRTYKDFEAYNWLEKYKDTEFNVNVSFKLRGTGLIIRNEDLKEKER